MTFMEGKADEEVRLGAAIGGFGRGLELFFRGAAAPLDLWGEAG
jgi:hypothetical protein